MAFFKKRSVIVTLIILAAIIGFLIYRGATKKTVYQTVEAKRGDVVQEVSVTGRVKAAENVDLAFEKSGKVGAVYVKIGTKVGAGQRLASLANGGLEADLIKAQANLAVEKANLAEMIKGTRPEEISISEVDLANAKSKAEADLKEDCDAALTAASEAVIKGKNALLTLSDLQFKYFTSGDDDSLNISDNKKLAVKSLLGADNGGMLSTETISKLDGGAYGLVLDAITNPSYANIDAALAQTVDALQKIKNSLDAVKITTSFTSTEKTTLSTEKTTIGSEITSVTAKQRAISAQKITNANNIAAAEAALALKKAGSTAEELAAEEAKVRSLEASVLSAETELSKSIIVSPIAGVVTKQDAKTGEIVSANSPLISIISNKQFEIEANIAEADIAKVKVGDTARVTLDAYGSEVQFEAKIVEMDPAETLIEGVPTYKTTFQFIKEDNRIKPGLTANIDVLANRANDVIYIPVRTIYTQDGNKTVRVLAGENVEEVIVKTGLRGSDGNIEIVEGLKEGDKVIANAK